ncbi:FAD-binding protein [Nesterenkonia massiliensis]|uniref:FAD-binding protein n=1 Tax=Nesterenkonia massiliensis TaxID=1232429 RepID=A0ABT2HNW7_9MICC|nr:FAD-linked oxidase C-terminal domain-containing protein [Nesterenkonia massiliensis]MCT1606376.1 FAD-binding protein [Nesterenkonia massiliensis]
MTAERQHTDPEHRAWHQELSEALGEALLTGEQTAAATTDRSGWTEPGLPDAVVRARTVADIQAALRIANAHRVPVVTRGAATGLAGGVTAGAGSIVLDVSGLNRILEIDPAEATARVETGVITADLDAAAGAHGLFYAPDPGSVSISTIGGNIATNAGGLRGAKYGVTRDAVLGLEVVLADGRLIRTGRSTLKGVSGYDLTALFTGSEGTLGVIVSATVRLLPIPAETATAAAYFVDVEAAAAAASAIVAAGVRPTTLEMVDGASLAAIDELSGTDFAQRGGAFLLIQTDGYGAARELEHAVDALRTRATRVDIAADPAEAEQLIAARRLALPAIEARGRMLIEDIAVPRKHLAEVCRQIRAIGEKHDTEVYVVAHAGDGNLHPVFVYQGEQNPIPDNVNRAADEVFQLAIRFGGTLTGEHGVGLLKQRWLADELGEDVLGLSHQVKAVFDPHGILNPGKGI